MVLGNIIYRRVFLLVAHGPKWYNNSYIDNSNEIKCLNNAVNSVMS